jgi:hypothetical protein
MDECFVCSGKTETYTENIRKIWSITTYDRHDFKLLLQEIMCIRMDWIQQAQRAAEYVS